MRLRGEFVYTDGFGSNKKEAKHSAADKMVSLRRPETWRPYNIFEKSLIIYKS